MIYHLPNTTCNPNITINIAGKQTEPQNIKSFLLLLSINSKEKKGRQRRTPAITIHTPNIR